jgi:hypothetical protein
MGVELFRGHVGRRGTAMAHDSRVWGTPPDNLPLVGWSGG